ncbi:hypothetical protein BJV78DRAFT_335808 [Lactifluus subvellereus]|nr:hypothetical protein BJV78DRAFT_335808 [Lactifluus subvellereus]
MAGTNTMRVYLSCLSRFSRVFLSLYKSARKLGKGCALLLPHRPHPSYGTDLPSFIPMSSTNDATAPSLNLKDLENDSDPLAAEIRQCESPDHILSIFEKQARKFDEFRNSDSELMSTSNRSSWLACFSTNAALSAGVSLAFPPAQILFSGSSVLTVRIYFVVP